MAQWSLYGSDRRETFEKRLDPEELSYTLKRYQKHLGKNFTIQDLLKLEEISAMALIAEAINDAPEFLIDQIGKARHDISLFSLSDSVGDIAEAIRETT